MVLPVPSVGVLAAVVDESTVLYDPVGGQVHVLSETAEVVWQACGARLTRAEVCEVLMETSGAEAAEVAGGVAAFVADLTDRGLLGRSEAVVPPELTVVNPSGDARAHTSSTFEILDDRVVVLADAPDIVAEIDHLLSSMALPAFTATVGPDLVRLTVDGGADGGLVLHGPGLRLDFKSLEALLDHLPSVLNAVAARSATCLALHSGGVVAPSGAVLLLPAVSGSGKTTLTAALVQAGFGYLSDEAVGVRTGSLLALRYQKPLVLDATSREVLGVAASPSPNVRVGEVRHEAASVGDVGPVAEIVLPSFEPGATASWSVLTHMEAFVALAENALNLRIVGQLGLDTLAQLAQRVPCRRLVHGGVDVAVPLVQELAAR